MQQKLSCIGGLYQSSRLLEDCSIPEKKEKEKICLRGEEGGGVDGPDGKVPLSLMMSKWPRGLTQQVQLVTIWLMHLLATVVCQTWG